MDDFYVIYNSTIDSYVTFIDNGYETGWRNFSKSIILINYVLIDYMGWGLRSFTILDINDLLLIENIMLVVDAGAEKEKIMADDYVRRLSFVLVCDDVPDFRVMHPFAIRYL